MITVKIHPNSSVEKSLVKLYTAGDIVTIGDSEFKVIKKSYNWNTSCTTLELVDTLEPIDDDRLRSLSALRT